VKSSILDPVAVSIFAMLPMLGHLGWPNFDHLLLLLKVVGSNPPFLASPEQDNCFDAANDSIASQHSP